MDDAILKILYGELLYRIDKTGEHWDIGTNIEYSHDSCETCGDTSAHRAPGYTFESKSGGCFGGASAYDDTLLTVLEEAAALCEGIELEDVWKVAAQGALMAFQEGKSSYIQLAILERNRIVKERYKGG